MSRMASPGENVSFAVTIGTILSPVLGFDHLESLSFHGGDTRWERGTSEEGQGTQVVRNEGGEGYSQRARRTVPDGGLNLVGVRTADHKNLLHAC